MKKNSHAIEIGKRISIVTNSLRCKRHFQYVASLEKYLLSNGWTIKEDFDVDKIIIAACGFHDAMYDMVKRTIDTIKKTHFLEKNIVLMGCLTKTHEMELLQEFKGQIIHFHDEELLDEIINAKVSFREIGPVNIFKPHKECLHIAPPTRLFYIKIAQGCLKECTFCVINRAKGYLRSVHVNEIVPQFKSAIKQGYRKIHLMGEDTFAYGIDIGTNIIDLVETLLSIDDNVEFYFGSLHIRWLVRYWQGLLALCKRGIIKEAHIGLQHVNDHMLKKMGRPMAFADVYNIINTIKRECPDFFIGVDVIVGFPGETKKIFNELVDFFKKDKCINRVQHFGFSDVKGAPSYQFEDKVDQEEIVTRWIALKEILGQRAPHNQSDEEDNQVDLEFRLALEKDYFFCKDTFVGKLGNIPVPQGMQLTKSDVLKEDSEDFGF
jgi:MiaB/RimO family radical SAM methylthiotransferase